jgi:perosamine synthetase
MNEEILDTPHVNLGPAELEAVLAALSDRRLAGTAPVVEQYETELADGFAVQHAVAFSSGTAALVAALHCLGIAPGDEVMLAPTGPIMSGMPVLLAGATPVFVDTLPGSLGIDPESVRRRLTPRTRAIVSVPMWGYPCEVQDLFTLAADRELAVVEDAAHAHGSTVGGQLVGTLGTIGCFSTHERKLITTGEGGFALTDRDDLAPKLRKYRALGVDRRSTDSWGEVLPRWGAELGWNFKLSAVLAALGRVQLSRLSEKVAGRRQNAERIKAALHGEPGVHPLLPVSGGEPNYYCLAFLTPTGTAPYVGRELQRAGILSETVRFEYQPMYRYGMLSGAPHAGECPEAERFIQSVITVPCHEGLTEAQLEHIIGALRQAARKIVAIEG